MVRSSTRKSRTDRFTLTLLIMIAVIPLAGLAYLTLLSDEVSQASPFGRSGTPAVTTVIVLVALIGTVVAWRGGDGTTRRITATALFCAAGFTTVMSLFFLTAEGAAIGSACLLLQATSPIALIGQAVLRSKPTERQR